jgi:hypothetical protein
MAKHDSFYNHICHAHTATTIPDNPNVFTARLTGQAALTNYLFSLTDKDSFSLCDLTTTGQAAGDLSRHGSGAVLCRAVQASVLHPSRQGQAVHEVEQAAGLVVHLLLCSEPPIITAA